LSLPVVSTPVQRGANVTRRLSNCQAVFCGFFFIFAFLFSASLPISACGSQPGFHLGQPRFFPVYIVYIEKKEKLFYRKNEQKNTKTA
jgi:hypothetical protein